MCTQKLPDWLIGIEIRNKEMVVVVLDQFHHGISLGAILIKPTVNGVIVKFRCVVSQLTFEHAMCKRTFFIIQNWLNTGTLSERWIVPSQFLDHHWDFQRWRAWKRMEFDSESCILKDQFTQPQIDQFLASVASSALKVSPWVDCGFTYRGKMRSVVNENQY